MGMTSIRRAGIGCLLLCVASAGAEAPDVAALRADLVELAKARDALIQRFDERVAKSAASPFVELALELPDAVAPQGAGKPDRQGLQMTLGLLNNEWRAGECTAPKYNKAVHDVDASGLAFGGGKMTGKMRITVNADAWVPSDGKSRTVEVQTDVVVGEKTLTGTTVITGDYGSYTGSIKGSWKAPAPLEPAGPQATAAPGATESATGMIRFATIAYQEARAALLCLANPPLRFKEALARTRLSAPSWKAGPDGAIPAEALRYVRELRESVSAAAAQDAKQAQATPFDGSMTVDDPYFGPFGYEPFPVENGISVLPGNAGSPEGGQRWQFVSRWELLAVFPPDPAKGQTIPVLPEVMYAPGASYEADKARLGNAYAVPDGVGFAWTPVTSVIAQIAPPGQRFHPRVSEGHHGVTTCGPDVHGVPDGRWYGTAVIRAPEDCELFAAVVADDFGKLWVNGQLAWMSRRLFQPYALVRIALRKGDNRVILGCENEKLNSAIGLTFCTRGKPLAPDARAAALKQCREATLALPPLPVRGRHGDWSSRYPEADPPLAWDLRQKINVRWHVPLPGYSCAPPVVAGDRVYVNNEPHTLYCLNKDTGDVLWKRDAHVFEFVPEKDRAAAMQAWAAAETINETPEVKALDEQIAEAEAALRDDAEGKAKLSAEEREAQKSKSAEAKKQRGDLVSKQTGAASKWRRELGVQDAGWNNNYGSTFGAPVADDKCVWVKYGTGVAACFDRDGNRKWMVRTGLSGGCGNISSPVLLKGVVIIQGAGKPAMDKGEWERIRADSPPFYKQVMMGLDAETGKTRWVRPVFNTGAYGGATGLSPLRLSNGKVTRELVINGDGLVIDPEDGTLLSDCLGSGAACWTGAPVLDGNRAYFGRGGGATVVEFWLEDDGRIGARRLFTTQGGGGNHGVVIHAGRCWGNVGKGSHGRQPVPWHSVSWADAATGAKGAELYPVLSEGGLAYVPPAAAGGYVVASGNGSNPFAWSIDPGASAQIGFVKCDPEPYMAAECKVQGEGMTATPVFEGKRMYLRTYRSAVCIEVSGKEGRDLVFQTKAAQLFNSIGERPPHSDIRTIAPVRDFVVPEGVPVEECLERTAPRQWLFAGPVPIEQGDAMANAGGPTNLFPAVGTTIELGGQKYAFGAVSNEFVEWSGGWSVDLYDRKFYTAKCSVDVGGVAQRKQKSITLFYAVLHTDKTRVVVPTLSGGSGYQMWLAGVPVKSDDSLSLEPGYYPLLVKSTIQSLPPFVKKVGFTLSFKDIKDPNEALKEWKARVKSKQARLDEIARELPDSNESRKVASLLRALE